MWTRENRGLYERKGLRYPSDLSCRSARRFDADRCTNLLRSLDSRGSNFHAD